MQIFTMNRWLDLLVSIILMTYFLSTSEAENTPTPCPVREGSCVGLVNIWEGNIAELEVSCTCAFKESRDVSGFLTKIGKRFMCAHMPRSSEDPKFRRSSLVLTNCDVSNEVFPVKLLRLLRRSEELSISVIGAKALRLEKDEEPEDVSPSIDATFEDSEISGFAPGWFTGAKDLNLTVKNSKIGIISVGSFSNFHQDSMVDLKFIASDIQTVKSHAMKLPPNGSLVIDGGEVVQWEENAYQGGRFLSFEGVKITNIQTKGINVYGLKYFKMEACYIAELQEAILYERKFGGDEDLEGVKEIAITDNSISKTHPNAFAGLCREENLNFTNNFLGIVDGPVVMKLQKCEKEREWDDSTSNTGLRCDDCSAMLSSLNEQVCSVYRTSWCISCNINTSARVLYSTETFNSACKTHFYNYVSSNCSSAQSDKYKSECSATVVVGKSTNLKGGTSSMAPRNAVILSVLVPYICLFVLFIISNRILS